LWWKNLVSKRLLFSFSGGKIGEKQKVALAFAVFLRHAKESFVKKKILIGKLFIGKKCNRFTSLLFADYK